MAALRDSLHLFARQFALALQQSTRLRLGSTWAPPPIDAEAEGMHASEAHLPGAGWLVGLVACLSFAIVALLLRGNPWGPPAAAIVSVAATLLITGARAESALFRAGDYTMVSAGAPSANGRGVMALIVVLVGKTVLLAALASVSEARVMAALFAGQVLSRLAPLVLAQRRAPERDPRVLRVAALWCVVPLLLMIPAGGPTFPVLALLVAALACYALLRSAQTGHNTELIAGSQVLCELGFYLGASIGT
jgi:adenosylcobinamide-GDP ribazoletransferase